MSSKLLRGTFILTLGTFISKFLGLFYIIPFVMIIGAESEDFLQLYNYGYVPYTIFISIATGGLPLAVSKYIAKYNAIEEYAIGRKLFKSSVKLMLLSGTLAFLFLFLLAPLYVKLAIGDLSGGPFTEQDVVNVIRTVSFALILVPFLSIIRGFFQGHQSMGPSSVSQVVEQIVRIAFLLTGAFLVVKVFGGSRVLAIQAATFAAFVGAIGGLAVLFWYWKKRKPHLDKLLEQDKGELTVSLPDMYKEIIKSAFPFVIVGIAIPLYQMIDTLLFTRAMELAGEAKTTALSLLGAMSFSSHKLVMIPVSLATAFSLTLVPLITASFVREEPKQLKKQIDTIFQILLFLTVPAALGMSLLAEPLYTAFFGYSEIGGDILRLYSPVAIGFALFSVSAAILQGINKQKFTVFSFLIGFVCKLALTVPLVYIAEETGLILSYVIGFTVSIVMNAIVIRRSIEYTFTLVFRRVLLMIIMNIVMLGATGVLYFGLKNVLDVSVRMEAIGITAVCGLVGAVLYFLLALRLRLADKLFGNQMKKVRRKLRLEEA